MMQGIPVEVRRKWPRLQKLSEEVASLEKQHQGAQAKVHQLRAQLPSAIDQDLTAQAQAVRRGNARPEAKNEQKARKELEAAERDQLVLQRALESAQGDLSKFIAERQSALFEDVLQARKRIAQEIAEHAKAMLPAYGRYEDLHYVLKDLRPVVVQDTENMPAQRLTQSVIGVVSTQSSGPPRGQVEQILAHLVSLAGSEEQKDSTSAA